MTNPLNSNQLNAEQLQYDRGLHYGDGLFETIAVKSGVAELLDEHISRLEKSCERLNFSKIDFQKLKIEVEQQSKSFSKSVIKIIITRGSGGRGYSIPKEVKYTYLILHYPWPEYNPDKWIKGIAIMKCDLVLANQPVLAGMKHLNRLENVLARIELNNTEFEEGLLCDSNNNVIEATSSNIFIVYNNKIITPKLDKCGVSGIMRDKVIKYSAENGNPVNIQDIPYTLLFEADEIFLTNSIIGIWPVRKVNEKIYNLFPATKKLMKLLNVEV
jgi:4-amino-4-deoxychorismate lyase